MLVKEHYKPRTDVLPIFKSKDLKNINNPILFIGGKHDCFYSSKKTVSRISKYIKNAKSIILPDAGHVLINQAKTISNFFL